MICCMKESKIAVIGSQSSPTMRSIPLTLLFLVILTASTTTADPLANTCVDGAGNYTAKSAFASNLNLLLSSLSSSNSTFATDAKGSIPDRAYGLFLCRGDAGPADCKTCIQNAAQDILSLCPNSKQATVWYDNCELRYADLSFFSIVYEDHYQVLILNVNATDPEAYVESQTELLDKVMHQAAYNSSLKFATGTAVIKYDEASKTGKMYGLAQCTRDLSVDGCARCLLQVRRGYRGNEMKISGRVLGQSCNFRYEIYQFFAGEPTISLDLSTSFTPNGKGNKHATTRKVLLAAIPVATGMVIFFIIVGIFFRRRSAVNIQGKIILEEIPNAEWLLFDFSMLKVATENFSNSKKLGQGGFGTVYKGTLANGEDIAVKRLSASSSQGIQEMKNELKLLAKLQHKNLVRLLGVCLEEDEKLLVYEYVPNGSLDNFLFDPVKCKQLNWETRFKIIRGVARGLLYLHEENHLKVIHRDLKASNILLDADMSPKISDFGLARLFGEDETQPITSQVVGTFGYIAPEYARHGHFSQKSDVYSFGILVLEIVTGKRSIGFYYDSEISGDILSYTWEHWRNGKALEILDPSTGEIFSSNEVLRCIQIGLLCTLEAPIDRPPMSSVFLMLHGPSTVLGEPRQPQLTGGTSVVDTAMSRKESELRASEEFVTSKRSARLQPTVHNIGTLRRNNEDRPLIKQNSSEAQKAQDSTFNRDNINIPAEVN